MKTGLDLKNLAVYLYHQAKGDEFEFMVMLEKQPEFSSFTQNAKDMTFILLKEYIHIN